MRLLVCGGRKFSDRKRLWACLDELAIDFGIDVLIEGGSTGADRLAREWALVNDIPVETYEADWDDLSHPDAVIKYTKKGKPYDATAGFRRNQLMIDAGKPHYVVAMPGGNGTADMVRRARLANIQVEEYFE